MGFLKTIIEARKTKREVKRILKSNDSEKVEAVQDIDEEKEIEKIIMSINNKQKRAEAFEQNIGALNKERLKKIIPTLNDDSILKILKYQIEYLNNEEMDILYTTIRGIDDEQKRIKSIEDFKYSMSDSEVTALLYELNDEIYEKRKVHILVDKLIHNYIEMGITIHERDMLQCLNKQESKLEVLKMCLERHRKIKEKFERGLTKELLFDNNEIMRLANEILGAVIPGDSKNKKLDLQKRDIIKEMVEKNEINYEQARLLISKYITNVNVKDELKESLIKIQFKKISKDEKKEFKETIKIGKLKDEKGNINSQDVVIEWNKDNVETEYQIVDIDKPISR